MDIIYIKENQVCCYKKKMVLIFFGLRFFFFFNLLRFRGLYGDILYNLYFFIFKVLYDLNQNVNDW